MLVWLVFGNGEHRAVNSNTKLAVFQDYLKRVCSVPGVDWNECEPELADANGNVVGLAELKDTDEVRRTLEDRSVYYLHWRTVNPAGEELSDKAFTLPEEGFVPPGEVMDRGVPAEPKDPKAKGKGKGKDKGKDKGKGKGKAKKGKK